MKKNRFTLFIAIGTFLIIGCGPSADELAKQAQQDSIRKADSLDKQDSLAMVEKIKAEIKKEVPVVKYNEKSLVGRWFTKINDPATGSGVIDVYWKADKTTDIKFLYDNGQVYNTSSKWKYNHPYYEEVFPDGAIGKATIAWVNEDKFKLTIKQNQDTENYSGVTRTFERKK